MKPTLANFAFIITVLILAGVAFHFYNDNQKLIEEASRLETERDRALRWADSILIDNIVIRREYEALILHYRNSKAGQAKAEAQAAQSQNALRAAQKAHPIQYSDVQIDSALKAWYPEYP